MKLMQFLMGLDDCYQPVRINLLTRDPLPDVKDAYATMSREESQRGIPETFEAINTKMNATSFEAINTKMNATSFVAKSYNQKKGTVVLLVILLKGVIGYPPMYKKGSNASKQNGIKPNFNANCDTKGGDKQPTACNSPTSFTADQMQKLLNLINDTTSGNTQANMAGRISFFNGNSWFNVNFSKFYCGNTKFLVKTITFGWIIDSRANQHLTTSTIGMINVIDISNLNITVGHPNGTVATMMFLLYLDLDKRITLGTGSESGGLYLFDDTKNKSLGNVNTIMAFNVSKDLWHSRLGHPVDQGPYRVSSREGFKYFLTIVDDYSRAVWTYLLKTKDEVFDCFVNFIKLIHNQFNAKIKTVKSDNGTEFVNKKMFTLFSDLGGIPLNFWSDCILIAVYLINMLPSSVLNGSDKLTFRSVLFARDVRFYETVFPFKMKNTKRNDLANVDYTSDVELLTFFDNQITPSPNDEERATPCVKGGVHSSTDAAPVQSLEEDSATHIGDNILSEGNVQDENSDLNIVAPSGDHSPEDGQPNVRRSSRPTKIPAKFYDFMLDSKLKYGIEKHVNYSKLNTANYCFATTLNKSVEPTTYYDAVKYVRWVEAMNNEIEALIRNNTWTLTDLP
ncbi:ribonuclease H-like domain-containing protein, partial [Tanacetum coccineum]